MKKYKLLSLMVFMILFINYSYSQEFAKLAQTGCKFLAVGMDARSTALAEAFTSVEGGSTSLFYNPSAMANLNHFLDLNVNHTSWIADIKYLSASLALEPFGKQYGVLGFSLISIDYGDLEQTMVDTKSESGYSDIGTFSPTAIAFGMGYAISLSDKFSVGAQVKYISQKLGSSLIGSGENVSNDINSLAFDFGTLYKTGWKSFVFGMSIRNFSQEIKYQNEGFQLPLTFKMGISMDGLDIFMPEHKDHSLLVSVDAVHNRDYPEQINLGMEYTFMNLLSIRSGYMFNNDEKGVVAGVGITRYGFSFDYSYTPFGIFKSVNRLSFRFNY